MRSDNVTVAPELGEAASWLNVGRPLSLQEFSGCVVVLHFWTYCSIQCMHTVPVLRDLERHYRDDPVVVLGVHSGKLVTGDDPERAAEATLRYGITHPVAVDEDMAIWSRYAIRSWPTVVIIRPDGTVASVTPGEPDAAAIRAEVEEVLSAARATQTLAAGAPQIPRLTATAHEPLRFPGKVSLTPDDRILISDSGHHRVLLCGRDGRVEHTIGSGVRGFADGPLSHARFDDPQGQCMVDGSVYIADTRNHAIRRVDLDEFVVTTVGGTGRIGADPLVPGKRVAATQVALRSPWDLCAVGDCIYVALAGSHQIGRYFPATGEIECVAGTGADALIDGDADKSAWSQPTGITHFDGTLYVADADASALRAVDLEAGQVVTLVGQGIFASGDDDAAPEDATLQHCLGVAVDGDAVLIADTYNGKVKRWRLEEGVARIRTVFDGLSEPGSIAVADDGMFLIADTNAHRVLGVRQGAIAELSVRGAPKAPVVQSLGWVTTIAELPHGIGLKAGDAGVSLILKTPPGTALVTGAPLQVQVQVSRHADLVSVSRPSFAISARGGKSQMIAIELRVSPPLTRQVDAEVVAFIDYVACRQDDASIRKAERVCVRVPLRLLREGGDRQLELGVQLADIGARGEEQDARE